MEVGDLRQILIVFREEAREISERMTADLLSLETAAEHEKTALFESLFRGAHTLKGSAGSLGINDVAALAHDMESLLGQCQKKERVFQSAFTDAILSALDEVGSRLEALRLGQVEQGEGIRASQARLAKLLAGEVDDEARPAGTPSAAGRGEGVIRVAADRVEAVATSVDDLVVQRLGISQRATDTARLAGQLDLLARRARGGFSAERLSDLKRIARDVASLGRELSFDAQLLGGLTDDLRQGLRSMQIVPASTILDPFRRAVRDHAQQLGVEVVLDVVGAEVEADRGILEGLRGPLVHLFNNAVDHGIEKPQERKHAGKPARARIRVEVSVGASQLSINVSDDGRGIDTATLRRAAVARGVFSGEEAAKLDEAEALALIWRPGFSSADTVTETSGRGVGLDAVREDVARLGGRIELNTRVGRGTSFRIVVPLRRAASLGFLVESGGLPYLIPLADVQEVRRVHVAKLRKARGVPWLDRAADSLPVYALAAVLSGVATPLRDEEKPLVCVIGSRSGLYALAVDTVLGEREMSVRPLGPELQRYDHLGGASRTGDGRIVIVLEPNGLLRRTEALGRGTQAARGRMVLVVDDAATSRLLHRTLLEEAGFQVLVAENGEEALDLLATRTVDAVVSDVRMPRMDGLELTRRIRRLPGYREVPVVLVTSLASDTDRKEGLKAGATTYLVKGETPPERLVGVLKGFVS